MFPGYIFPSHTSPGHTSPGHTSPGHTFLVILPLAKPPLVILSWSLFFPHTSPGHISTVHRMHAKEEGQEA
jgi:hypothetical protein